MYFLLLTHVNSVGPGVTQFSFKHLGQCGGGYRTLQKGFTQHFYVK